VLEASYHWTGEKIRVTARLVDVRNGSVLRIYEGEGYCADLFTAQDIVSEKVAGTLLKDLTGEERKLLAKRYTENTRAYFLYVRGLQYYDQRTRDSIEKARQYFRQAIDLDPNYSLAYTGLTQVYSACANLYIYPPKEVMPKAKAAAEQALRLDDSLAEAHTALAITIYYGDWNFKAVEKEYKRALELDQNSAITYRVYAHFLKNMGRFDEALEANQRSLMLDPRSITSQRDRGMFLYQARRYDEAIEQCQRTIELDPTFLRNYHWLARAYADKGLYDQAVAAYLREEEVLDPKRATSLRVAYAVSGWRGYWQKQLNLYKEEAKRQLVSPIEFARIHARLEEKEQAIVWLEKAYDERDPALLMLNVDPEFRNLRSEPRFTKLLRDIGFSP
jgi:tetratricopeptide (TPR) repeat protein